MNPDRLAERVRAARGSRPDAEAVRAAVCDILNEKLASGASPAIARTTLGYPVHTVGDVTLFASLAELPASSGPDLYGPDDFGAFRSEEGIAYFFVDSDWNLVEGFDAPGRPGEPRKATFEEFAREHGRHFEGFATRRLDMCI